MFLSIILISIVSYLIGCINTSLIITKVFKKRDIREMGSGNAGFTNALRTLGKKTAVITFAGDFIKGVLAVWISLIISNLFNSYNLNLLYLSSFMCVLGHIFPCFFNFRGGKGILTAWSSTLLIDLRVFVILISVFLILFLLSKIISLGSVCAAISYPVAVFFMRYENNIIPFVISVITCSIVIFRHKDNIKRLLSGTEKKITKK